MSDKELKDLQTLLNEMNILLKHSGEKITIDKVALSTYFNLITLYKEIEGFNQALTFIYSYNKENKE